MPFDREASDDVEFERRLLAAARGDAGPPDVAGAWARLVGALGPVLSDPAVGGWRSGTGGGTAPALASATGVRLGLAAAAKWVLLGAVAGSAATAAILVRHPPGRTDAQRAVAPAPMVAIAKPGPPVAAAALSPTEEPSVGRERAATPRGARARHGGERSRGVLASVGNADSPDEAGGVVPAASSPLAAEVTRLDAARTSNAVGDYDGTVRLVESYHRDFPGGALAPDADVVALEAVAAKRDHAEVARRAALFLSRYPGDPHAARVKWLAEH